MSEWKHTSSFHMQDGGRSDSQDARICISHCSSSTMGQGQKMHERHWMWESKNPGRPALCRRCLLFCWTCCWFLKLLDYQVIHLPLNLRVLYILGLGLCFKASVTFIFLLFLPFSISKCKCYSFILSLACNKLKSKLAWFSLMKSGKPLRKNSRSCFI